MATTGTSIGKGDAGGHGGGALAALLGAGGLKDALRDAALRDPADALAVTVLGGAYLFFLAEKGHNEKVASYWDALVFVSTNLSVGYATTFAVTPAGKAIATALMTFGPALATRALDPPSARAEAADAEAVALQRAIGGKLDAILEELRRGA